MRNKLYFLYRIIRTSFTPSKLVYAFKLRVSYYLSFLGIVTRWNVSPQFISIEPSNACNLKCPECPVGMRTNPVQVKNIDIKLVQKILDELAPKLMYTTLYFQGEPLLNKDFTKIVKYAHSKNILTGTSTNAQVIDDNLAKKLVLSGLDRLIISLDGTTPETYEAYRIGAKLEKTIQAIQLINKWKKEINSPSPFLEIQFLVLKTNEHQLNDMRKLAKEWKVDKLTFKSAQLYDFENGHSLLTSINKYARYELRNDRKYHIKNPLRNRCKRLWYGAVVTSKGDVLPCCFDKDSRFVFGNINNQSFAESWHSEQSYKFKKGILKNRKQYEMCRNCTE